jgi:hypothetical protein
MKENTSNLRSFMPLILLFVFTCIIYACEGEPEHENLPVIQVEATDKAVASGSILDSLFLVPLRIPDSLFIGNVDAIKVYEDRLYVLDSYKGATVNIFSMDGQFVNQLNRKGNGPEEYANLESFCVDLNSKEIVVNDREKRRLFTYDLFTMAFKSTQPSDYYFTNIESIGRSLLTVSDEDISANQYRGLDIWKNTKLDENTVNQFGSPVTSIELTFPESFSRVKGKLLYTRPLEDVVYKVSETGFEPYMRIDFQDKKVPSKHDSQTDADRFEFEIDKNDLFLAPHLFNETKDLVSFWYYKGSDSKQLFVYNKANQKGINVSYVVCDFGIDVLPPPLSLHNEFYVSVISSDMLDIEQLKSNRPDLYKSLGKSSSEDAEDLILMFYSLK